MATTLWHGNLLDFGTRVNFVQVYDFGRKQALVTGIIEGYQHTQQLLKHVDTGEIYTLAIVEYVLLTDEGTYGPVTQCVEVDRVKIEENSDRELG